MLAQDQVAVGRPGLSTSTSTYVCDSFFALAAFAAVVDHPQCRASFFAVLVQEVVRHRFRCVVVFADAGGRETILCVENNQLVIAVLDLVDVRA